MHVAQKCVTLNKQFFKTEFKLFRGNPKSEIFKNEVFLGFC